MILEVGRDFRCEACEPTEYVDRRSLASDDWRCSGEGEVDALVFKGGRLVGVSCDDGTACRGDEDTGGGFEAMIGNAPACALTEAVVGARNYDLSISTL